MGSSFDAFTIGGRELDKEACFLQASLGKQTHLEHQGYLCTGVHENSRVGNAIDTLNLGIEH